MPYVTLIFLTLSGAAALWLALTLGPAFIDKRRPKTRGGYVAEIWLEWEICRGSTMYRQRFANRYTAWLFAKLHAISLDAMLPSRYRDTDWSGRPVWYAYEFAIHFGVRKITDGEKCNGVTPIWTTVLPGHRDHAGEHASAHPWLSKELSGDVEGFKL